MRLKKSKCVVTSIAAVLALALMWPGGAMAASHYKVLHSFKGPDGANPMASLIFDAAGNLYGTAEGGGAFGGGTVFKLTPSSNGSWAESVLYSFCSLPFCDDGGAPAGTLIFDGAGNLYGTTAINGGVVFELKPNADGTWTESVLHSFSGSPDGLVPSGALVFDAAGNLYGTTAYGGSGPPLACGNNPVIGCGTVFRLTPNSDGTWTESILYNFCSVTNCADGWGPSGGLTFDASGNLYGTTGAGGASNNGVVFKLAPQSDGSWIESVILKFSGFPGGDTPVSQLIIDAAGKLYGTTLLGGIRGAGYGVVFKLTPNANGTWSERILHTFLDQPSANPRAALILDAAGNLYGTTANDSASGYGTVFKITPQRCYTALHTFAATTALRPFGGLVLDSAGNLYGTASQCGSGTGCQGVVFEIIP